MKAKLTTLALAFGLGALFIPSVRAPEKSYQK